MALPLDDPARDCTRLPDFYCTSGCRDMLFHVREHDFTLTEIAADLGALCLEFLGFEVNDRDASRYRTLFGLRQKMVYWDKYEQMFPTTFLGMYRFWCRRPD